MSFQYDNFKWKKSEARAEVQKIQIYAKLHSLHRTPALKFLLKRVWMASDFSISGSGDRFKKIPLLVMEVLSRATHASAGTGAAAPALPSESPASWNGHNRHMLLTVPVSDHPQWSKIFFPLYLCFCLHHSDSPAFGIFEEKVAATFYFDQSQLSCVPWRAAIQLQKKN